MRRPGHFSPPVRTTLLEDVNDGYMVLTAGTEVEVYYGDPDWSLEGHFAVRTGSPRRYVGGVLGSALACCSAPVRQVVSV